MRIGQKNQLNYRRARPPAGDVQQIHLDGIATKVTPGAHAMILLDQAAKTLKIPSNISLMPLPPRSTAREISGSSYGQN
jgi:hypothetical protein